MIKEETNADESFSGKPTVVLGNYKSVSIPAMTAEVTDDDIAAAREELRRANKTEVRMSQKPIEKGDIAEIDFEGYIDGVAFEGGHGENYMLEIGSDSFIAGFEEQLEGHKAGECVNVKVRFPNSYPSEITAGREALFKVTIKDVTGFDIPDYDILLIESATGFDSVAAYEDDLRKRLLAEKQEKCDLDRENAILSAVISGSEITVDQKLIEARAEEMFEAYARQLREQNLEFSEFLEYTGMSGQEFLKSLEPEAEWYIKCRSVLQAVAEAEKIVITEDELTSKIRETAEKFDMEADLAEKKIGEKEKALLAEELAIQKAMNMLLGQ